MIELVYYPTIDNIYNHETSYVYKNINHACLDKQLKSFEIIDEPTYKREGTVVAFNIYDNLVYRTQPLNSSEMKSRLELDCPTEVLTYYEGVSEEIIESCQGKTDSSIIQVSALSTIIGLFGVGVVLVYTAPNYIYELPAENFDHHNLVGVIPNCAPAA